MNRAISVNHAVHVSRVGQKCASGADPGADSGCRGSEREHSPLHSLGEGRDPVGSVDRPILARDAFIDLADFFVETYGEAAERVSA
jgi:hypothetical protein